MEKKLSEYRAKKRRNEFITSFKDKLRRMFLNPKKEKVVIPINPPDVTDKLIKEKDAFEPNVDEIDFAEDDDATCCKPSISDLIFYGLCLVLWVTLFALFIKLQFGAIFFIVSALVGIYLNTRTGPKPRNEVSAYSVFNKNCKSIDGALKAEDFEREIRYGIGSMH